MMKLSLILLLVFSYFPAFSQLKIEEKSKVYISYSESDLVKFINLNHFDYALMSWKTSYWVSRTDEISCLFKQDQNWYLAKISHTIGITMEPIKYEIKQRKLNKLEADSIWHQLDSKEAFKYIQADFDKLPESCQYTENGKHKGLISISDAATFHLMQISDAKIRTLNFYAPDFYFNRCYPHFEKFNILKGFIYTVNQLSTLAKN